MNQSFKDEMYDVGIAAMQRREAGEALVEKRAAVYSGRGNTGKKTNSYWTLEAHEPPDASFSGMFAAGTWMCPAAAGGEKPGKNHAFLLGAAKVVARSPILRFKP
jgi:hypothetical protein